MRLKVGKMNFFSRFNQKKEETGEKEEPISIETYVVDDISLLKRYGLENPLIVVSFPGRRHENEVVTRREISIRDYLEKTLIKKQVETESTEEDGPEKRYLRGNGESDRVYHGDLDFHFYESVNGELKEVIKTLERNYSLTISRELPDFLVSDLASLV